MPRLIVVGALLVGAVIAHIAAVVYVWSAVLPVIEEMTRGVQ